MRAGGNTVEQEKEDELLEIDPFAAEGAEAAKVRGRLGRSFVEWAGVNDQELPLTPTVASTCEPAQWARI